MSRPFSHLGGGASSGPWIVGLLWFVVTAACIYWLSGGTDPRYFTSPDEAVNKLAAELILATGEAKVAHPVEDVEDLLHMRQWVSVEGRDAIPVYPPMLYILHAGLMKVPVVGKHLVVLAPASAMAAFAMSICVLGRKRRWVAVLAPAVAFPALYWAFRPWMNMSLFIAFVCVAIFFWAIWKGDRRPVWLFVAAAWLALAASVRPDYSHVVFASGLFFTLAEAKGSEGRAVIATFGAAGVAALAIMLTLNAMTTGNPFLFGYELPTSPGERANEGLALPTPLAQLRFLFLPFGYPSIQETGKQLGKYWLGMGPVAALTVGSAASIMFLLRSANRRQLLLCGLGISFLAFFVVSRIHPGLFGASLDKGALGDSLPRYWGIVYLLAAVPICLTAMKIDRPVMRLPALLFVATLAVAGSHYVLEGAGRPSVAGLRGHISELESEATALIVEIPADAVVYTERRDKVLWSHWNVATYPLQFDAERTAASMARVALSGSLVYAYQVSESTIPDLNQALARFRLRAEPGGSTGLYRVNPLKPERLLQQYGCQSEDTQVSEPEAVAKVNNAAIECFLRVRTDILELYAANGWDTSPANFQAIFEDWWQMTTESGD